MTRFPCSPYSAYHHGTVLRPESQTVAERRLDAGRAALIGDEIEVARRIRIAKVDGGRQEASIDGQRRRHETGRAAGALGMADHRLDRRSRNALGVPAEHLADASRFDGVVDESGRAVVADVADLLQPPPRAVDRRRDRP